MKPPYYHNPVITRLTFRINPMAYVSLGHIFISSHVPHETPFGTVSTDLGILVWTLTCSPIMTNSKGRKWCIAADRWNRQKILMVLILLMRLQNFRMHLYGSSALWYPGSSQSAARSTERSEITCMWTCKNTNTDPTKISVGLSLTVSDHAKCFTW